MNLDPGDFILGALEALANSFAEGVGAVIDAFNDVVFGIDAPGTATKIASWGPPDAGLWVGTWALYWALAPLALSILVYHAMKAVGSLSDREAKAKLAEVGKCGGMILLGWPIAIGGLHLADSLAMAFVPEGATFFETPGNVTKLGLGAALGSVALLFQTGMALTAIVVVLVEHVVLIGAVAAWPISWAFKPSDGGFANAASGIGLSTYVGVAGAKVVQSMLAYLVFESEWAIAGTDSVFVGVFGSAVALGVTFIGIPVVVGRNFIPEAMTMLGTPAVNVAENYAADARGHAKDTAKDYATSARHRVTDRVESTTIPSPSSSPATTSNTGTMSSSGDGASSNTTTEATETTDTPSTDESERKSSRTRRERSRRIDARRRRRREWR